MDATGDQGDATDLWDSTVAELRKFDVRLLKDPKDKTHQADVAAALCNSALPKSMARRVDVAVYLDQCLADPRSNSGIELVEEDVLGELLNALRSTIKRNLGNSETHCAMGFGLLSLGRDREALGFIEGGLATNQSDPRLLMGKGCALARMGDDLAALMELYRCLRPGRGMLHANRMLGMVLSRLGRQKEALHAFTWARALNPNDISAHDWMSRILSDDKRYGEAKEACERACGIKRGRAFGLPMPSQVYP